MMFMFLMFVLLIAVLSERTEKTLTNEDLVANEDNVRMEMIPEQER